MGTQKRNQYMEYDKEREIKSKIDHMLEFQYDVYLKWSEAEKRAFDDKLEFLEKELEALL